MWIPWERTARGMRLPRAALGDQELPRGHDKHGCPLPCSLLVADTLLMLCYLVHWSPRYHEAVVAPIRLPQVRFQTG